MKKIYASSSNEISEREKKHYALARKAASEGIVLLKNDNNALPIIGDKIALYGIGARKTLKGGTGSGAVNERYHITIEQGLKNAGCTITTKSWLDDYDMEYDAAYAKWKSEMAVKTAGLSFHKTMAISAGTPFRYPAGRLITKQDIKESQTDTAIYVLARQAGEGHDRMDAPGDYRLTDVERNNLECVADEYKNTILVINVGGFIDLSFLDEVTGINAVVFYTQAGMEGGNALADLLSGKDNFSGKLTSSWAFRYSDYPSYNTYSHMNGNLEEEDYVEGIFVGYRFFEALDRPVQFPFGYGLSYTIFHIEYTDLTMAGSKITVMASVKNIGHTYAGKEVVQLYMACPQTNMAKERRRLVGFVKTNELKPGEEQSIKIDFDFSSQGSYNQNESAWILEQGEYLLYLGNASNHTMYAAVLSLDHTVITEKCRSCCAPDERIEEIEVTSLPVQIPYDLPNFTVQSSSFVTKSYDYKEPTVNESESEKAVLDSLEQLEMTELLRGGGLQTPGQHNILGASGKSTIGLGEKGINNIIMADGPAGVNVIAEITIEEDDTEKPAVIPEQYTIGSMAEIAKYMLGTGVPHWRYATAWPAHMLLAQTWNTQLLEEVGEAVGCELLEFGVTLWLAPGMNIHRNPLCGRNFEYFSEDPLISGKMATAITRGVQSHQGVGVTIKHFACNNQENNRIHVSSNVNERALREIYLKGFEIAVRESSPAAVMTSYNKINHTYTSNSHDLCTKILRSEWEFKGVVMTDWGSCDPGCAKPELAAVAGNDLIMPGSEEDKVRLEEAVLSGNLDDRTLRRSACRVLRIIQNSDIYAGKK